jgi:lactoylglutathione lyase
MMIYSLTTVFVKDIEKSIAFFSNVLGLSVVRRMQGEHGPVFLGENGKPNIELIGGNTDAAYSGFSLGFAVDSLEQATLDIEAAGCQKIRGPISPNPNVSFSFFRGPDGIELELIESK